MARWEPGARERLQEAAVRLYGEHGFEVTTAADIAAAVGLTERTFFRHFADKREVLFDGQDVFDRFFLDPLEAAPEGTGVPDLIAAALDGVTGFFTDDKRSRSRARSVVINANLPLRERELAKLDHLGDLLAAAFRARGVTEPAASLAARTTVSIFHIAFAQWITDGEARSLAELQADGLAAMADLSTPVRV